jgi:hypothetical protein
MVFQGCVLYRGREASPTERRANTARREADTGRVPRPPEGGLRYRAGHEPTTIL